jgi:hypothetical protein
MLLTGADGIAIDACGGDRGPAAPFNRLINANDDGGVSGDKGMQQEQQQPMAERPARLGGAIQDTVIVLEVRLVAQAHAPQGGGDSALTGSEDRADEQDSGMLPSWSAEQAAEGVQDLYNGLWQVEHLSSFLGRLV